MHGQFKADMDPKLDPLREVLSADGYDLQVSKVSDNKLVMRVLALDNACEECLVPEAVMLQIVRDALGSEFESLELEILYPGR